MSAFFTPPPSPSPIRVPGAPLRPTTRRNAALQHQNMDNLPSSAPTLFRDPTAPPPRSLSPSVGRRVYQILLNGGNEDPVAIGGASFLAGLVENNRIYINGYTKPAIR